MSDVNYSADIEIDETALDVEWLNQPKRMLQYCHISAEAQRRTSLAKERREVVKARLILEIQKDPEKFGLSKTTKDMIEAVVLTHPDYLAASEDYINAEYEQNIAIGTVRAFEQRKSALENLVRLHASQYFAGPSTPRDLSSERKAFERLMANRKVNLHGKRDENLENKVD